MSMLDRMFLTLAQAGNGNGQGEAANDEVGEAGQVAPEANGAEEAESSVDFTNLEEVANLVSENAIPLGIGILKIVTILTIAWILANWVSRIIRIRGEKAKRVDTTIARFFANIVRWAIIVLGLIAALGTAGVETTSFAALLAAAGFAVGLALQGSLGNFAAGVMLLLFRPFKVGDVVKVNGELGKVDQIDLFTTTMDTFDNRRLIMPNGAIFGTTIENITFHPERRADVDVGVSYDTDLVKARQVLMDVANSISTKLPDRDSQVVVLAFNDSSIDWQVRVWCKREDWLGTKEEMILRIKQGLDQAGISIPFPQRDVHLFQQSS
ncbi:MAG: mechanosensitive ion channel family protein [Phycisphaeraceae bacterium]|nr:MAG: mechanosensitive ion channel family protein [Phycisphaeraceae bacterium]